MCHFTLFTVEYHLHLCLSPQHSAAPLEVVNPHYSIYIPSCCSDTDEEWFGLFDVGLYLRIVLYNLQLMPVNILPVLGKGGLPAQKLSNELQCGQQQKLFRHLKKV